MADVTGKLSSKEWDPETMTIEEFYAEYRKRDYPCASNTTDLVIFAIRDNDLKVLLILRSAPPDPGHWACPGGFLDVGDTFDDQGEDLDECAARELSEETGLPIGSCYLEQLYTFGKAGRDPRKRVITTAYFALIPPDKAALVNPDGGDDAAAARWFSVEHELDDLPIAMDHRKIIDMGVTRIRGKIDYTSIAFELVPPTFTTGELRAVYEVVKGRTYDTSNFNRRFRRMLRDGVIEQAPGERRRPQGGRPARVYRFVRPSGAT